MRLVSPLRLLVATAVILTATLVTPSGAEAPTEERAGALAIVNALKFRWGLPLYDFAWEYGESLTSFPLRGSATSGRWWLDESDGTGRANTWEGAVLLDSQLARSGPGDRGTTSLTLQGTPQKYGRWELKEKAWTREGTPASDFEVRLELVPARARDYDCGAHNVLIAGHTPRSGDVTVGVNAGATSFTATRGGVAQGIKHPHTYAVEVAPDHITWFSDARVVATTRNPAALSGVPMTLRMSLVGDGAAEMNRSRVIVDWVRGFPIDQGNLTSSGRALTERTNPDAC